MTTSSIEPTLHDFHPPADDLKAEVLTGLAQSPKLLPCKLLYDRRGSALFDQICQLDEYYPTRTETAIMRAHLPQMIDKLGQGALLIELGSGSATKTDILLGRMCAPAGYVPIDISRDHLRQSANRLASQYPALPVMPVCADYLQNFTVPDPPRQQIRRVVYFPGSTIGNFHEADAKQFLHRIAELAGPGGGLLIGVDLRKDPSILIPAYDDAQGVTAAFNLNMLHRINRELAGDFAVDQFVHQARWNETMGRVEMHLVSQRAQVATVAGKAFAFAQGESIRTECSYKYTLTAFAHLAADFTVDTVWMDSQQLFSVQYLTVND